VCWVIYLFLFVSLYKEEVDCVIGYFYFTRTDDVGN
jgi:hypothetical protein